MHTHPYIHPESVGACTYCTVQTKYNIIHLLHHEGRAYTYRQTPGPEMVEREREWERNNWRQTTDWKCWPKAKHSGIEMLRREGEYRGDREKKRDKRKKATRRGQKESMVMMEKREWKKQWQVKCRLKTDMCSHSDYLNNTSEKSLFLYNATHKSVSGQTWWQQLKYKSYIKRRANFNSHCYPSISRHTHWTQMSNSGDFISRTSSIDRTEIMEPAA